MLGECRLERASTCLTSRTRQQPAETTQRPWYSAPVAVADRTEQSSESSDSSCLSVGEKPSVLATAVSDTTTAIRRRLADETLLDLTTPTTDPCGGLRDHATSPRTPGSALSRHTSDTHVETGSRPGSGRHSVLPPIRQIRSVDTAVTVGAVDPTLNFSTTSHTIES